MQRIVVLNPKGGSGKTTIAINLAACYAANGERPALMDLDHQASSMRWLRKRPHEAAAIHGIAAFERPTAVTRSWQTRIPAECRAVVVDTPAAVDPHALRDLTRGVDAILIPVMPSEIDIHATAKCIADLLLVAKIRRSERRIGIIANRVRSNTRVSQALTRFRMAWRWDGNPSVLMSRAVDETGAVQPTRAALMAARGAQFRYHYNAIQSWNVSAAGDVSNVYA